MTKQHLDPFPTPGEHSVRSYLAGFALSVALTVSAFALVWAYRTTDHQIYSRGVLLAMLASLAIVQLVVQALFFLHVSHKKSGQTRTYAAVFTILVVLTIVIGSLWVMQNLNYRMMPAPDSTHQAEEQEGIYR